MGSATEGGDPGSGAGKGRTGISATQLWRLKRDGRIPFCQPHGKRGKLLFPRDAIEQSGQSQPEAEAMKAPKAGTNKIAPRKSKAVLTCEGRFKQGGEIGIRTRDAGFPTYRISNPALSATQPSLRHLLRQRPSGPRRRAEYSRKSAQIQGHSGPPTGRCPVRRLLLRRLSFVKVEAAVSVCVEASKDGNWAEKLA